MQKIFSLLIIVLIIGYYNQSKACHAVALVNPSAVVNPAGDELIVNAFSSSVTCGCTNQYWLDIEIRCLNEPFDAAPFNPGFWGPLSTYPYFQSQILNKTGCNQEAYPTTNIPFTSLCPGIDYQVRFRENHNGDVGPWTTPIVFTVPGTPDPLDVIITSQDSTVCAGECTMLSAQVTGGCNLSPSFSWDTGSSNASTLVCPTEQTTYTVTVTEECSGIQTTQSITIDTAGFSIPGDIGSSSDNNIATNEHDLCSGEEIELTLENYFGDIQWQISDSPTGPWNDIPNLISDTVNYAVTNQTTYFRAQVAACLDTAFTDIVSVIIRPQPEITINDTLICLEQSIDLVSTVTFSGGVYTWSPTPSNDSILAGISPTINTTYYVDYDLNGCTAMDSALITVFGKPEADFDFSSVCEGQQIDYLDQSILNNLGNDQIVSWDWDLGSANSSDQNPSITYNTDSVYVVSLLITTNNGCQDSITKNVEIYPNPVVDFTADSVCFGYNTVFINNTTINSQNTSNNISSWDWDLDNGSNLSTMNPTYLYLNEGVYAVTLTANSNNGCTSEITKDVYVFPKPFVNFTTADVCQNEASVFNNLSEVSNSNTSNSILINNWNFGDGVVSNNQAPQHLYQNHGTYFVQLIVETNNGCTDSITKPITIYPIPEANFIGFDLEDCSPVCFELNSTSTIDFPSNIVFYEWKLSDGTYYTSENGMIDDCFENNGNSSDYYDVELVVTSELGCQDSILKEDFIVVHHNPIADFNYAPLDPSIARPNVNFYNQSIKADNYQWLFGDLGGSFEENPEFLFPDTLPGIYNVELIARTTEGCADTVLVALEIKDEVIYYIPNSFTPDNDDYNQTFQPIFTSGFDPMDFHMTIMNRWGEIIFESYNAEIGWDGTYGASSNQIVKEGTYIWKIEFREMITDKRYLINGHVTLLR